MTIKVLSKWASDVWACVKKTSTVKSADGGETFTLEDIYRHEKHLAKLHPDNRNIRAKIRQQLQVLRDEGFIEFIGRGVYRRIKA